MSGLLFDGTMMPIENDAPVVLDGPNSVVVTHPICQILMGVEDGAADALWRDEGKLTLDLTYVVPLDGAPMSEVHKGHLVAVSDRNGNIAFFGHTRVAVLLAISQVLKLSGGGNA